jgi:hypothetical protein
MLTPRRPTSDEGFPLLPGERRVRFVFGALAGLFTGLELASRVGGGKLVGIFVVLLTVVGFGLGAAWLGDRFWRR